METTHTMSGSLLGFRHVINVIERDIDAAISRQSDNLARHFWGNFLGLLFAMTDISLRHANFCGERGLREAK